jgi:hypothetical protein
LGAKYGLEKGVLLYQFDDDAGKLNKYLSGEKMQR